MKKAVKWAILGVIALAAAGGGIYWMTAPVTVPLYPVTAKTAELSFSEQGLVVAQSEVLVYAPAQGQLLRVNAAEGQSVRAGDILCEIDAEPLRAQVSQRQSTIAGYELQMVNLDVERSNAMDELRVNRDMLSAEIAVLDAQERSSSLTLETKNVSVEEQLQLQDLLIEQGRKEAARAADVLQKAEVLYTAGSMPRAAYEEALDGAAKAQNALDAAEQERRLIASGKPVGEEDYYANAKAALAAQIRGIDRALAQDDTATMKAYYQTLIEGTRAAIAQLERDIENCKVAAPTDGMITSLPVLQTNYVSTGVPVAQITVQGDNTIEVYVSTEDVDSIKPGDAVELTLKRREGDAVFGGEVLSLGTTAQIKLSTLGVEERKVKVRIAPHTQQLSGASFGVGYAVDVKFFVYRAENKLTVPKTALYQDGDKDMLWVVRDGTALAVEVTAGRELRTETVIEAGLFEGDMVVTEANNPALKNGVRVKAGDTE